MKYDEIDLPAAYDRVYNLRRDIHERPAFIQQLHVWNAIKSDYPQRRKYPEYRHWEMSQHANIVAGNPLLDDLTSENDKGARRSIYFGKLPFERTMKQFTQTFPFAYDPSRSE